MDVTRSCEKKEVHSVRRVKKILSILIHDYGVKTINCVSLNNLYQPSQSSFMKKYKV